MDMDMEQLKLILETLRGITDGAGNAAMWWIALHYGTKVLSMLLTAMVITVAVVIVFRFLRGMTSADSMCRSLAVKLGVKDFDTWYGPDRKRLLDAIDKKLA